LARAFQNPQQQAEAGGAETGSSVVELKRSKPSRETSSTLLPVLLNSFVLKGNSEFVLQK
jgi:hypothetical protein